MRVDGPPELYVLGVFDTRITIYSQQVRALNLVYSLLEEKKLTAGKRLAIIGGGVAGMTAAAAAVKKGCDVKLFEEAHVLLHNLQSNVTRWIHPHIYEWPNPHSEDEVAGLPILDWKAGLADEVHNALLNEWNGSYHAKVNPYLSVNGVKIEIDQRLPRLSCNKLTRPLDFDVVILAVGFGSEKKNERWPYQSYWSNNDLHQIMDGNSAKPTRFLISGTGDGGLVDLLRVRIDGFKHDHIVEEVLGKYDLEGVKEELLRIEHDVVEHKLLAEMSDADIKRLFDLYAKLPVPQELRANLYQRLRPDTRAILNGPRAYFINPEASILNRFLVSQLLAIDSPATEYYEGLIADVKGAGSDIQVIYKSGEVRAVNNVVLRHGASSSLQKHFPEVFVKCGKLETFAVLDQTRRPIWEPTYFGEESPNAHIHRNAFYDGRLPVKGLKDPTNQTLKAPDLGLHDVLIGQQQAHGRGKEMVLLRHNFKQHGIEIHPFLDSPGEYVAHDLHVGLYHIPAAANPYPNKIDGRYQLKPGTTIVVVTKEHIHVAARNVFGNLASKASLAFQGITVSNTKVDPLFNDKLRIAVTNGSTKPFTIEAGQAFCSIFFSMLEDDIPDDQPKKVPEWPPQPEQLKGEKPKRGKKGKKG